ncbi:hypothetical protein [Ilumatobacter sp.]|uniref:hypothetical protein n=1 Tax=Ilumatobacter sp. TaxID=1967498 RepID=UPI003AF899D8
MAAPTGFDWSERANGDVAISHHGREVTIVRGRTAERLTSRLATATDDETQHLLARATGNYRRGNERR